VTKPIKVEFAPGCFDNFDGTQEELDGLMAEIQSKFASMTPEELTDQSRLVSVDDLLEDESISDNDFEQILGALVERGNRTLQ
jgi:hypothetical protein